MKQFATWPAIIFMLPFQIEILQAGGDDVSAQNQKIHDLEQKIAELDQRLSRTDRQDKSNAKLSASTSGVTVRSGDGNFLLKIGGDLQVDSRFYPGDSAIAPTDTTVLRRARLAFSGTLYKYVDFMFRPDFGLGNTVIYDAYIQFNYFPRLTLRAGKFKPPLGLERLLDDDNSNFIERGLPSALAPQRDIGYQLAGDLIQRRISYQAGVFDGVPDGSSGMDAAVSQHRDYVGRLFFTPFLPETKSPLNGLGVGVAASHGSTEGQALPVYKTFGQTSFFTFAPGVTAAGHRTRVAPQAYYYAGPFGLLAEYTLSEEGFQKGNNRRDVALRAYQVQATYVLTGEKKGLGATAPRKNFDPRNHGWGAVELAARIGDFSVERGIYDYGFAASGITPRRAREWAGGVNWYLNRAVKIACDYGHTNFGGGAAAGGNRPAERVILTRLQIYLN